MAEPIKISVTALVTYTTLAGAAVGLVGTGAVALDRYIVHVHERERRSEALAELCGEPESGDPEKDAARNTAISALGGCQ